MSSQDSGTHHSALTAHHSSHSSWRRNLAGAWVGQLMAAVGFSFAFPFIPLYVQELGIADPHEVEMWAGLLGFAAGLSMAASAPVWGALADRYGRKPMLLRAMLGGAVFLGAMGLVQNVEQLLVLRFLQGAVTGTMAASTALVASFVPRARLGFALGLIQVSAYAGFALGPLVGGLIADAFGYRYSFFLTSAVLAAGGIIVGFFVREGFAKPLASAHSGAPFADLGSLLRRPSFLLLIAAVFGIQGSELMVMPIFPLFVQALTPEGHSVPSTVGLILGAPAAVSAASALAIGRISDRVGHRRMLAICTLGAGLAYLPQSLSQDTAQVLLLQVAVGLFVGGMLPSANALISLAVPRGSQGAAFGLSSTAASLSSAVGPLAGAALATQLGLRSVFVAAGLLVGTTGMLASLARRQAVQAVDAATLPTKR